MPYARNRQTTRRGYAGRARTGRRYTGGTATHGYQRTAVRRMQGPPAALYSRVPTNALALKSMDVPDELISLNSLSSPVCLVVPKLGSAFFNRLSNRTRGVSLQLRGMIFPTYTNALIITQQKVRIIIYYDRQSNGANPSISDILLDTNQNGATNTDSQSMINMNNKDRFMILRDRYICTPEVAINGATSLPTGGVITDPNGPGKGLKYEEFIKLKGLESLYNSTNGGDVGDISAGAFGILAFSSDASGGNDGWHLSLSTRFKFLD